MTSRNALAAGVLLVLVACSSAGDTTTSASAHPVETTQPPTTLESAPSTVAPTTTSGPTTIAPGSGPSFQAVPPLPLTPPGPLPESEGASGSGCRPGSDDLPDGVWFVYALAMDGSMITVDLACFYFGDIAWEIAGAEGEEAYNDFWIVNESTRLRSLAFADDAIAWSIAGDTSDGHSPFSLKDEWPRSGGYTDCLGEFCGVWLYVNDGVITELVEQYIP